MLHCLFNRGRIKGLDDSIYKLNKYCEAINLRKQQRNDLLPNEKSVGLNSLKLELRFMKLSRYCNSKIGGQDKECCYELEGLTIDGRCAGLYLKTY